ncbi:MAG: hypothetical protein FJY17_10565 [Bacteroidetes bacterium]|nr:hypothetical protein [Bacteroidota bacterium]
MASQNLVFLTGCINPNGVYGTKIQNPTIRLHEYLVCIKFYLLNTKLRVLFVENSGIDISQYFDDDIKNGRLEVLTYQGNKTKHRGKGYSEMEIIEHAIAYSEFFKNAHYIIKITGRYRILNIRKIMDFYETMTKHIISITFYPNMKFCDAKIFLAKAEFYEKYLVQYKESINDPEHYYFEHALNKATLLYLAEKDNLFCYLPHYPRIFGTSGTFGTDYNSQFHVWLIKELLYKLKIRIGIRLYMN